MPAITKYDEKIKPLYEIIKSGDYHAAKEWIDAGNAVFNPESKMRSVLCYATSKGFFSILEILLDPDWKKYPDVLNQALSTAVEISHTDCIRLLLENGANVESISWDRIFSTRNGKLTALFFEYGKSADGIQYALSSIGRGTAGVLKSYLPSRPEFEIPILEEMLEYLDYIFYYANPERHSKYERQEEAAKQLSHYMKLFSLLKWTGVDTRKRIIDKYGSSSIFEEIVQKGSLAQLKSLSPTEADPIAEYAQDMQICDAAKLKYLIKLGFQLNDRPDGTSTTLENAIKHGHFRIVILLADFGAKLPVLDKDALKRLKYSLFHTALPDGIFLALAKIISADEMKILLTAPKTKELFGDTPEIMIRNLYDPYNSESPDTFRAHMESLKSKLNKDELHPVANKFRLYCSRNDREPDYFPIPGLRKERQLYHFTALKCSKTIRPWLITFLDSFVREAEKRGATFTFQEESQWGNRIKVTFCACISGYEIPLEFHESQTSRKKYLAHADAAESDYSGKLQFCHRLHGTKAKLEEEKSYLALKGKITYLIDRLYGIVEREEHNHQKRIQQEAQWQAERLAREEAERKDQELRAARERRRQENR